MPDNDEAGFQFLADHSLDVICRAGAGVVLHYVSPSSLRILGWTPEEMIGKRLDAFVFPEDVSSLPDNSLPELDEPPITIRMRRKDGLTLWVEITRRTVRDSDPSEDNEMLIVMRDITEQKSLEERLRALELINSRTGLATHRGFDEALEREWNRALREGSHLSLLLLDFNHFRQFHDWRQHREGDRCLVKAAAAVLGSLRVTDLAASYGAEDIAVILPSTGSKGAANVARKVRSAIQALRSPSDEEAKGEGWMLVRIGIATAMARPGATPRMPEILRIAADSALQKAKSRDAEPLIRSGAGAVRVGEQQIPDTNR